MYLNLYCVKSVRIPRSSGPHFLAFRLYTEGLCITRISPYSVRMRENPDQNNSEYGQFSRSREFWQRLLIACKVNTAQKMKFSIKDFFSKCNQICRILRIWSHLLKKPSVENFIFCTVDSLIYANCIETM